MRLGTQWRRSRSSDTLQCIQNREWYERWVFHSFRLTCFASSTSPLTDPDPRSLSGSWWRGAALAAARSRERVVARGKLIPGCAAAGGGTGSTRGETKSRGGGRTGTGGVRLRRFSRRPPPRGKPVRTQRHIPPLPARVWMRSSRTYRHGWRGSAPLVTRSCRLRRGAASKTRLARTSRGPPGADR